jgi:hypothetical protein
MVSAFKFRCVQLVFISFSLFCLNGEIICLLLMSFIGHVRLLAGPINLSPLYLWVMISVNVKRRFIKQWKSQSCLKQQFVHGFGSHKH